MRQWFAASGCLALAACSAQVDQQSVRATSGQPTAAQVDVVQIPYDPNQPRYVVTVQPFTLATQGSGDTGPETPGVRRGWGPFGYGILPTGPQAQPYTPPPQNITERVGPGVAAQLETALGNCGNIVIIDYDFFVNNARNPAKLVKKGEVGPYVIRGTVTEFNEVANAQGSAQGGSFGWVGAGLAIGGAIAGNAPATYTGVGLAAANPTYEQTRMRRTGSVGMDLKIVDPENGRLAGTANVAGTFTSEAATGGFSLFGIGGSETAYAASALGQAQRAAMNDAVRQITQRLAIAAR
jgi:curli biogenesis system outer membrane secretion channel CsgG